MSPSSRVPCTFLLVFAAGCGGDDSRPAPPGDGAGRGSVASGGSVADSGNGGTSGSGGDAAASDAMASGGTRSDGGGVGCGDGVASSSEECDGLDLAGATCRDFGFDDGMLVCTAVCEIDASACSGVENCADGRDNDGNGRVDCFDDACTTSCATPCSSAPVLPDPAQVTGTTEGRISEDDSSCTPVTGTSGPDMIYEFTATHTGRLDVSLASADFLNLSVRSSCTDASTELGCHRNRLIVPIEAGESIFIVVDGYEETDQGPFELVAASRPVVCGDGVRDDVEECDDGNVFSDDGCDSTCHVESTETEPNDDASGADEYVRPFFGQISPGGDVDVVSVTLTGGSSTLTAEAQSFDDRACALELMDTVVDILDTNGTTVLASDDDGGPGLCSLAVASGLAPGTYYVRVAAAAGPTLATFPYQLTVTSTSP